MCINAGAADGLYAVGYGNARQAGTVIERPCADALYAVAYVNARQAGAVIERAIADRYAVGYGNARQAGTATERTIADARYADGYDEIARQAGAATERTIADARYADGYDEIARQAVAVKERTIADARYAGGYDEIARQAGTATERIIADARYAVAYGNARQAGAALERANCRSGAADGTDGLYAVGYDKFARQAGETREAFITITHEKVKYETSTLHPQSELIEEHILVIVPGQLEKVITLDQTSIIMLKDDPDLIISANIINGSASDYSQLAWSAPRVSGQNIISFRGNGKNCNIHPMNVGTTTLRAQLPNGIYADCIIAVQSASSVSFSITAIHLPPGYSETFTYETKPSNAMLQWTSFTSQGSMENDFFSFNVNETNKTVTVTAHKIGSGYVQALMLSGGTGGSGLPTAKCNIFVENNYSFELDTARIITVEPYPGTIINVPYHVYPNDLFVDFSIPSEYSDYVRLFAHDRDFDKGTGVLKIEAVKEKDNMVFIAHANNPNDPAMQTISRQFTLKLVYENISFTPVSRTQSGAFTQFKKNTNDENYTLELGDGEEILFYLKANQENANIENLKITYGHTNPGTIDNQTSGQTNGKDNLLYADWDDETPPENGNKFFRIRHKQDYVEKDSYLITKDLSFTDFKVWEFSYIPKKSKLTQASTAGNARRALDAYLWRRNFSSYNNPQTILNEINNLTTSTGNLVSASFPPTMRTYEYSSVSILGYSSVTGNPYDTFYKVRINSGSIPLFTGLLTHTSESHFTDMINVADLYRGEHAAEKDHPTWCQQTWEYRGIRNFYNQFLAGQGSTHTITIPMYGFVENRNNDTWPSAKTTYAYIILIYRLTVNYTGVRPYIVPKSHFEDNANYYVKNEGLKIHNNAELAPSKDASPISKDTENVARGGAGKISIEYTRFGIPEHIEILVNIRVRKSESYSKGLWAQTPGSIGPGYWTYTGPY